MKKSIYALLLQNHRLNISYLGQVMADSLDEALADIKQEIFLKGGVPSIFALSTYLKRDINKLDEEKILLDSVKDIILKDPRKKSKEDYISTLRLASEKFANKSEQEVILKVIKKVK